MHPATRVQWFLQHGEWPAADLDVCHTCDNPPCVRPDHLWLGTESANIQDCITKGRNGIGGASGESNPQHKLTDGQVHEIMRRMMAGEKPVDLAPVYGVTPNLLQLYRRGARRPEVTAQYL